MYLMIMNNATSFRIIAVSNGKYAVRNDRTANETVPMTLAACKRVLRALTR